MLNVFGDEEDKFLGCTTSTVNPLTSIVSLKIYIVETGRLSNCRLHQNQEAQELFNLSFNTNISIILVEN